jgi:hypothetical protein
LTTNSKFAIFKILLLLTINPMILLLAFAGPLALPLATQWKPSAVKSEKGKWDWMSEVTVRCRCGKWKRDVEEGNGSRKWK